MAAEEAPTFTTHSRLTELLGILAPRTARVNLFTAPLLFGVYLLDNCF